MPDCSLSNPCSKCIQIDNELRGLTEVKEEEVTVTSTKEVLHISDKTCSLIEERKMSDGKTKFKMLAERSTQKVINSLFRFSFGELPPGVRWMSSGNPSMLLLEVPPTYIYTIGQSNPDINHLKLVLPWTVWLIKATSDKVYVKGFARYSEIQSLDDELFVLPFSTTDTVVSEIPAKVLGGSLQPYLMSKPSSGIQHAPDLTIYNLQEILVRDTDPTTVSPVNWRTETKEDFFTNWHSEEFLSIVEKAEYIPTQSTVLEEIEKFRESEDAENQDDSCWDILVDAMKPKY